jgi:bifunctional ADP-heptose synthase (sugar kinase/adenylyltransferase)
LPSITSAAKLERLVRRLRGRRIGVVGDLMLDRYVWGTATRLSPEAAVPVVDFVVRNDLPWAARATWRRIWRRWAPR